ncbi:2-keto-4-pentenoate hydratase [Gulosibacter chungangensis]|uniref:2-keto-4-pentenoate hydratase n=1 Tax=Gulosibacter chungangensis TaxID=979746 RepID=A0A7J5BC02_9MICO|nr:fumarylacetoacetate hydrolase family protein [Gulosibacter chungangensis]KAB1643654.1 2-keto-4-pentenoate hydratase [Gulosibacter chungangensis]
MEDATRQTLAQELASVYAGATPVSPLTERYADMDLEDAYRIQELQVEKWLSEGRRIRGRKIGLTSKAMQRQLGVTEPDYGVLLDDFFYGESTQVGSADFTQPRIEPELAFILGKELRGPNINVADVVDATAWVVPSIEIIDSRIADWKIKYFDTVADNASSGGVVLGSTPRRINEVDLRLQGVNVFVNGQLTETGAGAAALGSPLNSIVWLANVLGKRGIALEAGQVVLPGSVTKAISVQSGDTVSCDFAGMGSVSINFS